MGENEGGRERGRDPQREGRHILLDVASLGSATAWRASHWREGGEKGPFFVPPPPPQPEMGNDEMIGDHLSHRICPRSREENEDQSRELPMSQRGRGVDRDDRNVMRCGLTRALHALAASPLL